jgi:dihydropteroate synthase
MGSAAAVTAGVLAGAAFLRVHDVRQMRQVLDVAVALRDAV